jgi:hypothetical protein
MRSLPHGTKSALSDPGRKVNKYLRLCLKFHRTEQQLLPNTFSVDALLDIDDNRQIPAQRLPQECGNRDLLFNPHGCPDMPTMRRRHRSPVVHDRDEATGAVQSTENVLRKGFQGSLVLGEVALKRRQVRDCCGESLPEVDLFFPVLAATDEYQILFGDGHILNRSMVSPVGQQNNGRAMCLEPALGRRIKIWTWAC